MDGASSFNLGFTQLNEPNIGRVFKSEDVGWAKNKSKKLHDPLVMAKVNIEKLKKDDPSSSKAQVSRVLSYSKNLLLTYLNIPNCNYQGQITKCLLLLEVKLDNINELHIQHVNGNMLCFSIK
ncbi:hypothetical protein H5410_006597 [Solanum commersonii]|uniref:Uncharacterized protein n=1 Tax=Solanum commersonii TaxID=4109 RepID=A0A9J6AAR0_SOLCO|nr:hypothetical protein H5410_006597 [Solanum commersonii]